MKSNRNILLTIPPGWLNFLVFSIGLIVVFAGALVDPCYVIWKQALLGVGGSILASAVVTYLTSHYLRSQNAVVQLIDSWRLDGLFRTRAEANQRTNKLLVTAREVDIVAFGLRNFRDRHSELVRSLVKSGLRIRILTLVPSSTFVSARTKSENLKDGQLKKEINDLITWVKELRPLSSDPAEIDIRIYDSLNLDFYYRIDDVVFVGPYLHGQSSQQTFTYSFARGGIGFEYWKEYFDKLWNDKSFCQSALQDGTNEN